MCIKRAALLLFFFRSGFFFEATLDHDPLKSALILVKPINLSK